MLRKQKKWLTAFLLSASVATGCSTMPTDQKPAENPSTNQPANQEIQEKPAKQEQSESKKPEARAALSATVAPGKDGVMEVTNMHDILVVVNKKRNLKAEYEPTDLVQPNVPFSFEGKSPKKLMRKEAAQALESLFAQAQQENIAILGQSAYRSYQTQESIFKRLSKKYGSKEEANKVSAYPGQSEHQTGLAIDITSERVGYTLEENFGETPEGKWLAENAAAHGFIIRYQKGKEDITGYSYEPWHIRYVGKEIAQEIVQRGITLEEYLSQ